MNQLYFANMQFLEFSKKRGFFYQTSNEVGLAETLQKGPLTFYVGFDCTATSLHVGSLMQIMNARNLQKFGHKPIILLGSGTTRIGDPSYRDTGRPMLSAEQIEENKQGIRYCLEKFIHFGHGPTDAILVDNFDWLSQLNYLEFLRDYGSLFSVNRMLSFEGIKSRLEREQNLSFLEFNYMLLQAYDFAYLYKKYNCRLQLGGSDQWGNIINGVELCRRLGKEEVFALTTPLLTTHSGQKMGKTAQGAVWLDEKLFAPYEYYQYWRNVDDKDVLKCLLLFTELADEEISDLAELQGQEINRAKEILAYEATKLCHGQKAADQAADTAYNIFKQNVIKGDVTEIAINDTELQNGVSISEAVYKLNLVSSKSEAKRLIKGGGVKLNGNKVDLEEQLLTKEDLLKGQAEIAVGKKKFGLIRYDSGK